MDLSLTDEQVSFRENIIKFARKELNENIVKNETEGNFSFENWRKCADYGLLSFLCPKENGGYGADLLSTLISIQALSYACKDSGLVHAIVTQLCCLVQISLFGNESQKREYLQFKNIYYEWTCR
jgi:alkylation response protein AidB-like acyl-CoA dehydrogenase